MTEESGLTVGQRFRVVLDDCCIEGEFTATIVEVVLDEPDDDGQAEPTSIRFDNGVVLTNWMGVGFELPLDEQ